jgi:hypothetical protein
MNLVSCLPLIFDALSARNKEEEKCYLVNTALKKRKGGKPS